MTTNPLHSPELGHNWTRPAFSYGAVYGSKATQMHTMAGTSPGLGNFSRWLVHRCGWMCRCMIRTKVLLISVVLFAMTMVILRTSISAEPRYPAMVAGVERKQRPTTVSKEEHRTNGSSKIVTAKPNAINKTRPEAVHVVREAKRPPIVPQANTKPRPSNATQPPNVTTAIIYFAKIYKNHYPSGDEFFTHIKKIAGRRWKPNMGTTTKFRNDIRAALGREGKSENVYLTKHNTPRGEKMMFYMAGKTQGISNALWETLPSNSVFRTGGFKVCSVVGSSGILKGSHCGRDIDVAEFVFRFNLAPVQGFEDDVGTKTNFTTMNPTFIMYKLNSIKHADNVTRFIDTLRQFSESYLYLPGFAVSGSLKLLVKAAGVAREAKVTTPVYGSPDHFLAVANLWRTTLDTGMKWPSTGLYAVSSLFDACERINVYGFWPYPKSYDGKDVPYHYNNNVKGTRVHNFDKEFKTLMLLHEKGIINVNLHPCK